MMPACIMKTVVGGEGHLCLRGRGQGLQGKKLIRYI